jgi:cellulose synthase/poly-beta-1,6-N-acetylglucosamine synthase-like glycosyltransferase
VSGLNTLPTDTDGLQRIWEKDVSKAVYPDWNRRDTTLLKEVGGVFMGSSRYTAITCAAREVKHNQDVYEFQVQSNADAWGHHEFSVNPHAMRSKGITTLICVTMYNEDEDELHSTLKAIARNIYFCSNLELDNPYRKDWREVAVVIVSDGREKVNGSTKNYASRHGFFDEDTIYVQSKGLDVQCHVFEHAVQFPIDPNTRTGYLCPLQVMFAVKEHNAGKLDSHFWFCCAFADVLDPKYTFMIDVGTIPVDDAMFRLVRSLDNDPYCAGVCGEISVADPFESFMNPVVMGQFFEYKISNILDKSLESSCGFISVLPGAFSGYRYRKYTPHVYNPKNSHMFITR